MKITDEDPTPFPEGEPALNPEERPASLPEDDNRTFAESVLPAGARGRLRYIRRPTRTLTIHYDTNALLDIGLGLAVGILWGWFLFRRD